MPRFVFPPAQGTAYPAPHALMPRTVTLGLLFASGDFLRWSTHGPDARYVIIPALIAAVAADCARSIPAQRSAAALTLPAYAFLAWLWLLAVRALAMDTWQNSTAVLLAPPLVILAAGFLMNSRWPALPRKDPGWVAYAPYAAAFAFGILGLLDALNAPFGRPLTLLNHEKTFIAVYVLLMPRLRGSWLVKLVMAAGLTLSLHKYPAATTYIAVVLVLAAVLMLRMSRNPALLSVLAAGWLAILGFTGFLGEGLDSFYDAIGRGDNTATRLSLWNQAWSDVRQNPLAGGAMEERITGTGRIDGTLKPVPFHNSYLTLMVGGGFVALLLFSSFIAVVVFKALGESRAFRAQYAVQWLPALLAALTSMTVNPIVDQLGSAVFFYVLLAVGLVNLSRKGPPWAGTAQGVKRAGHGPPPAASTPLAPARKMPG